MTGVNALTIDVEDYFQVSAFEPFVARESWDDYESRVVPNTQRILALLTRHSVQATFFVLGWVAEKFPELVREIHAGGHEVASHGYWHRLIYRQTPEEFRADVRRAREVLQAVIGEPVTAYRAPSFSVTEKSLWALDILCEEGYLADSSVFPIHHDRYGVPGAKPDVHTIETAAGRLWEFPPATVKLGPLSVPVSGGGYFRLYPFGVTRRLLARVNRRGEPFMFYLHPWEVDPGQPRLPFGSRITRFRHYVNLSSTEDKLDRLLRAFRFGRFCDVLKARGA